MKAFQNFGFSCFGCDLDFGKGPDTQALLEDGSIRFIEKDSYRIPFEDEVFELVLSTQVLEHVLDYPSVLSEIKRVLKPGGISVHIFPSRYRLIEGHTKVPLSSMIQCYPWLVFWAFLRIRNQYQKDLSFLKTARLNHDYLRLKTNYISKKELNTHFKKHFETFRFIENDFLNTSRRGKLIRFLSRKFPFLSSLYSTFISRVVFLAKE